ncbi:MAG: HEAT repeat domain-containing protein [Methanomicrobia archaeon]|nr:HEAT repeat domain-containing protein [Methanomicrobia archaeon]
MNFIRWEAAKVLGTAFPHVPDKEEAWADLVRLIRDAKSDVKWSITRALGTAFPHVPDKRQAWEDLHRLTRNTNSDIRREAAGALGTAFPHVPDKRQAWEDLHRLTRDANSDVQWRAAESLGLAFQHVPDKRQAWADLHRLTRDKYSKVRVSANHALGRVSIFKATEAETEDAFRKEIENAIAFFEASSREAVTYSNPARFCLPFYRSFYTVTFKKPDAETEVQNYLVEAKRAAEGSESKEKLLEAVENLAGALREVQDAQKKDLDEIKKHLDLCKQHCDQAAKLLETTEVKAPGATALLRRSVPIIDQRIKEIVREIYQKAVEVCRLTRGTSLENVGYEINQIGKNLLLVEDSIDLEKGVENLLIVVSDICDKIPGEERGVACELLEKAKAETYIEDRINLINIVLGKIPAHIRTSGLEKKIDALIVSLKPGIREELTISVGAEVFGTGVQHVITISLQAISYPELKDDLTKLKEKSTIKLASLPQRLAHKVKDYLIRTKKEDFLE